MTHLITQRPAVDLLQDELGCLLKLQAKLRVKPYMRQMLINSCWMPVFIQYQGVEGFYLTCSVLLMTLPIHDQTSNNFYRPNPDVKIFWVSLTGSLKCCPFSCTYSLKKNPCGLLYHIRRKIFKVLSKLRTLL